MKTFNCTRFFKHGKKCFQSSPFSLNFKALFINRSNHFYKYVKKPKNEETKEILSHASLMNLLQKCDMPSNQLDTFHACVKLEDEDIEKRQNHCHHLETMLKKYFTSCSLLLVGSSANGLGSKGCDVDLSFQFSDTMNFEETSLWTNSLDDILDMETVPLNKVSRLTTKNQLLLVQKALQRSGVRDPFTILPGRCRILNFCIDGLAFDLAINNSSAVHSTNLMRLCEKLDPCVAPLVRTINYWAKRSELIGGVSKFKSYALFLLVVYFLQTRKPPLLPSMQELSQSDYWSNGEKTNQDFTEYLHAYKLSKNTSSTEALLREFFFFYVNFDFSWVICPWTGHLMDRKILAEENDMQAFEFNTICIQDPLNLQWNVTTGVNFKNCKSFLRAMISVCEIYHNSHLWRPTNQPWGLACILDSPYLPKNVSNLDQITLEIPLVPQTKEENCAKHFDGAVEKLKHFLSYGLMFECSDSGKDFGMLSVDNEKLNQDFRDKNSTVNGTGFLKIKTLNSSEENSFVSGQFNSKCNVDSKICFKSCFECSVNNTWSGRNALYSEMREGNDLDVCVERDVSKKVLQHSKMKEYGQSTLICECCGIFKENELLFVISLKNCDGSRFLPKLAVFLKDYINKIFVKL